MEKQRNNPVRKQIIKITKEKMERKRRNQIISVLSVFVVITVMGALMLKGNALTSTQTETLTASTSDHAEITVTYKEGDLEQGATLSAHSLDGTREEIIRSQLRKTLQEGETFAGLRTWDIYAIKDGAKIEPAGKVKLTVKFSDPVKTENPDVAWKYYGITNQGEVTDFSADTAREHELAIKTNGNNEVEEVSLYADSFSSFALAGITAAEEEKNEASTETDLQTTYSQEQTTKTGEQTTQAEENTQAEKENKPEKNSITGTAKKRTKILSAQKTETFDIRRTESPIDLSNYIKEVYLAYQDGENWIPILDTTENVPADARFKITVNYDGISLSDLKESGGNLSYTIPAAFIDVKMVNGSIQENGNSIGTITVDTDNRVSINFYESWMESQESNSNVHGDFYVTGLVSSSTYGDGGTKEIVFGNVTKSINFESDVIAKHGELTLKKEINGTKNESTHVYKPTIYHRQDGDYLQYTLTVQNGAQEMPDVKVADAFYTGSEEIGNGNGYVEYYVGVTGISSLLTASDAATGPVETKPDTADPGSVYLAANYTSGTVPEAGGASVTNPGVLVWNIGKMSVGETRTLTYRVKLKDGYTGGTEKGSIANLADVFSKKYSHGGDKVVSAPVGNVTVTKNATSFVKDVSNHNQKATYVITVTADSANSYVMNRLHVHDEFKIGNNTNYNSYISCSSFEVYKGNALKNAQGTSREVLLDAGIMVDGNRITIESVQNTSSMTDPSKAYLVKSSTSPDYDLYLPEGLAAGETYSIVYEAELCSEIYTKWGQGQNNKMANTATVYDTTSKDGTGTLFSSAGCWKDLETKRWTRKIKGQKSDQPITISFGQNDRIYNYNSSGADGQKISEVTSDRPVTYTIPEGNYKFSVLINEAGDWDVSSATLRDAFSDENKGLVYSGYVRMDAYSVTSPGNPSENDETALASFQNQTPKQTVWINVNNLTNYQFTPSEVGMNGKYAYILTYYAVPNNVTGSTLVTNCFSISGSVSTGTGSGNVYWLDGVEVTTKSDIEGSHAFSASKHAWYYDRADQTWTDTGATWWYIQVEGNVLDTDAWIRDIPHEEKINGQPVVDQSEFYGMFCSNKSPGEYDNIQDFLNNHGEDRLSDNAYTITRDNNETKNFTVSFTENYTIPEGKTLYIITRLHQREFSQITPPDWGKAISNNLQYSGDGGKTWSAKTWDKIFISSKGRLHKEAYSYYTYDKKTNTVKCLSNSRDRNKNTGGKYLQYGQNGITETGTYVEFGINVNLGAELLGEAWVTDTLPEGLEPVYVRDYWHGAKVEKENCTASQTDLDDDNNWNKYTLTSKITNVSGENTTTWYYNPGTRQIRWKAIHLHRACVDSKDQYNIEYQVVCRVTDPDALLGGNKEFTNTAKVEGADGISQESSATISVSRNTITKVKNASIQESPARYPFKIDINPLGEDLVQGSEELTLVDEMGANLVLAQNATNTGSSLEVKDTETGENIDGWNLAVTTNDSGNQVLTLSKLPDQRKITVTYETAVNASPGQTLTISNHAYWSGFATTGGSTVEDTDYSYTAGGTAGTDQKANLLLTKEDGANVNQKLSGAVFKLEELTTLKDNENGISYDAKSIVTTVSDITTGEDGTASYGLGTNENLKYNTVYRLTETKAPNGYVLDSTPYLFAVAKGEKDSAGQIVYPTFQTGVHVEYNKARYEYTAYNHKYKLSVEKRFKDKNGEPISLLPQGTYTFGLYKQPTSNGEEAQPVHILSMTISGGQAMYKIDDNPVNSPEFTELDAFDTENQNKPITYAVYELDSGGKPVQNGQIFLPSEGKEAIGFCVNYTVGEQNKNTVTFDENTSEICITVTNQITSCEQLPATGGPGTYIYTLGGVSIIAFALMAGFILRRKKQKMS